MNEYNVTARKGLVLAGFVALPLVIVGCFPSPSDSTSSDDGVVPIGTKAAAMDGWMDGVPTVTWGAPVTLKAFRPGQASYEYLSSANHTGGITADCSVCHGSYPTRPPHNSAIRDEDEPVPDVNTVDLTVQAAYDATNFYLKANWRTPRPGIVHGLATYQSGQWVGNSTALEPDTIELPEGKVYAAEDRFATMFMPKSEDISVGASFHRAGCFVACHEDLDDMPEWSGGETLKYLVSGTPALGAYGTGTESNAMVTAGTTKSFPDMWHWRGGRSAAVQTLTDGFVMDSRASDAGANPWTDISVTAGNLTSGGPINGAMYKAAWMEAYLTANHPNYTGPKAINAFPGALWSAELDNAPPLIIDGPNPSAEQYSAAGVFPEGSVIPRRYLRLPAADSRNNVKAYSSWRNGTYTLILQRARTTGNNDDHVLNPDTENYTFAFAVHQGHTQHRWHHVTFPVTLGMEGSNAVIKAKAN